MRSVLLFFIFCFAVKAWAQPANDQCSGAITLTPNSTCTYTVGTSEGATDNNETGDCTNGTEKAVWFNFVASQTSATVTVDGSTSYDAVLGANTNCGSTIRPTGGTCTDLTGDGGIETMNLSGLTLGSTYYIQVHDWNGDATPTSTFDICVVQIAPPPAPANDDPCGAILLTLEESDNCTGYPLSGTNIGATSSTGIPVPGCASYSGGDVWYSFVVPTNGTVTVDLQVGDITDSGMAFYSSSDNTCSGSFTLIECDDDDSPNGAMSLITRSGLTPGNTIFVRVWEYGNNLFGTFSVCGRTPPPPVGCPIPTTVSSNTITSNSANITWVCSGCLGTYVVEYGPPGFTPGTGATAGVGGIVVNPATSPTALTSLDPSSVYNVYVRQNCGVDGFSSNSTVHIFNTLAPPPTNDNCSGATALTVNADDLCGSVTNGTVVAATASPESQATCGGTEDDDVWFSFVATSTTHTIDLLNITGSTSDMYHSLWSGSCGSLVHTGLCSDANSSTASSLSIGNTYYLRVYTWTGTAGQTSVFDVCIGTPPPPPSNDDCSGATPISDGSAISQSVTLATDDLTAPICSGIDLETQGVWFVYSVPTNYTGTITIAGCNSSYDMRVRVYEGSCGSFTCVAGDDDDDCVSPGSGLAETTTFNVDTQGAFHGGNSGSRAPKDYYVLITGAGGTLDFTVTANLVLPITISKISAHNIGKSNLVSWTTSSEVNNDVQMVERSKDGISGWEMVGKVNGTNSREAVTYEVYDNKPFNTSFYRIHSVDFDGKEQFSKIVSVQREGRSGIITSIQPNPTANFVEIDLQPEFDGDITYTILDVTGKLLKTAVFSANNDALNTHMLDMSDLQSGLYFVTIQGGGINQNAKILKQ